MAALTMLQLGFLKLDIVSVVNVFTNKIRHLVPKGQPAERGFVFSRKTLVREWYARTLH